MRKILILAIATFLLVFPSLRLNAGQVGNEEKQQLKLRHKTERGAMKLQQQHWKQSVKGQLISKAVRSQMKHQMQREKRELRERQKNEVEDLKDRQRLLKESQNQY